MKEIFERQRTLMGNFHPIESSNSTIFQYQDIRVPVDMNTLGGQARIKHLAWYTVEEIAEAVEAEDAEDKLEELIDAIHFFVELCITAGYDYDFFDSLEGYFKVFEHNSSYIEHNRVNVAVANFIRRLGAAMNQLKNKPWKRTHTPFDETYKMKFESYLRLSMFHLLEIGWALGIKSADHLRDIYNKKNNINAHRQRSGY